MNTLVPNGIAILSAVLKKAGFKNVGLFDPTFYTDKSKTWDEQRVDTGQIRPFDFKDRNLELKKTDMFHDFTKKVETFKPDIIVTSILINLAFFFLSSFIDFFKKSELSASFHFGLLGGKCEPISPLEIEPSIASVIECNKTSASECPINPYGWSIGTPPNNNSFPGFFENL